MKRKPNGRFKELVDTSARDKCVKVYFSFAELTKIKEEASSRNISVSDFLRRVGLGRKAKVHPETDLVIAISQATYAIREVHAENKQLGIPNDEARMSRALDAATEAIIAVTEAQ